MRPMWGAFSIFEITKQPEMKKIFLPLLLCATLISCKSEKSNEEKEQVDLIVVNANAYTVDDEFSVVEAFAVKDGKFVATGTAAQINEAYFADSTVNAEGNTVLPGFIDAHAHFYGYGLQLQTVDLRGTKSFNEVLSRLLDFQAKEQAKFVIGGGWDQNDWENKEFPVRDSLDILFPNTPVAITRIDGHAMLANKAALDAAGITTSTRVEGGEIEVKNGRLTGILIDNPMALIDAATPALTQQEKIEALLDAQSATFGYGLTTVNDAGIDRSTIELIDSLQKEGSLKIRIYAMISNTPENLDYYLAKGPVKTERLNVRSFKFYGDGALGSRGAALKEPYSDHAGHYGALLSPIEDFKAIAERIAKSPFQMNSHAIGDSANSVILKTYAELLEPTLDRRWRVEHSQVIDGEDFKYFSKNIIPSVQPTHATSDMYWAEDRLGAERIEGAYAFKKLLDQAGLIALGTDFPVENVSPFYTFYAAVARKDLKNYPEGGYQMDQALSREETLKGMTIWAAYSNFEEEEKGSIEEGKFADFVILEKNIMEVPENEIPNIKVSQTYVNGEKVY